MHDLRYHLRLIMQKDCAIENKITLHREAASEKMSEERKMKREQS